ncbi:MAG: hypothetical protein K6E10_05330 [Eubacterium sp.]|nr:hypothetical protein [Eubacterium sp.]
MKSRRDEFRQNNYMKLPPFSSFLPGIAGSKGIPVWCYYVNRGQGVVSFGVQDKDHSILEFYPAEKAYGEVQTKAFRTFIKEEISNQEFGFFEAFTNDNNPHEMIIGRNHMMVKSCELEKELEIEASYYVLPEERIGGLVRRLRIINKSDRERKFTILDGLPIIIPYGISIDSMKNMTETAKAWMQSEYIEEAAAIYRVRASMEDTAKVTELEGAAFAVAYDDEGKRLPMISDPGKIFGYDKAYKKPINFINKNNEDFKNIQENHSNVIPSAFFMTDIELGGGEEITFYEIYGNTGNIMDFTDFISEGKNGTYFTNKELRAEAILDEVTGPICCQTNSEAFDAYARNSYMDNGLRGGFPIRLGHNKVFYLYSRKHGDLERDYNFFSLLPEYYSQGNGNFRDVAQNRRLDTFFSPFVGKENINTFMSFLQPDAYNPLLIQKQTFSINLECARVIMSDIPMEKKEEVMKFFNKSFTPGSLYMFLEKNATDKAGEKFIQLIDFAKGGTEGSFVEGYWCDHWTYLMDFIDEYLLIYPDKEKELLTEDTYTYYWPEVKVNPFKDRYVETEKGIRQYRSISEYKVNTLSKKYMGMNGKIVEDSLYAHLLTLAVIKFASLDPYSFGIEMEGGKPGWYDALNGLPGILGSSYGESLELIRLIRYLKHGLTYLDNDLNVINEVNGLINDLHEAIINNRDELYENDQTISFWYAINKAKEDYREIIYRGASGLYSGLKVSYLKSFLNEMEEVLMIRQPLALRTNKNGLIPMYFYYEVIKYKKEDGIYPQVFKIHTMPDFLEGQVHGLKVLEDGVKRRELYRSVKDSDLYDKVLSMYKVNSSLNYAPDEAGRCKFFTPGWLENESIFLHMEYKYLLELQKAGLYKEFYKELKNCFVCYMKPEIYGRSNLENSSFIASSANPNKTLWGRGFVARLSGSTVEFLSMWRRMMFGENPFYLSQGGELELCFKPEMPGFLIPENKKVSAKFLGKCLVTYHFKEIKDYSPDNENVTAIEIETDGKMKRYSKRLRGDIAKEIRDGMVREIHVYIQ